MKRKTQTKVNRKQTVISEHEVINGQDNLKVPASSSSGKSKEKNFSGKKNDVLDNVDEKTGVQITGETRRTRKSVSAVIESNFKTEESDSTAMKGTVKRGGRTKKQDLIKETGEVEIESNGVAQVCESKDVKNTNAEQKEIPENEEAPVEETGKRISRAKKRQAPKENVNDLKVPVEAGDVMQIADDTKPVGTDTLEKLKNEPVKKKKFGRSRNQDLKEEVTNESNDAVVTQPGKNLEVDVADPKKNESNAANSKHNVHSAKQTLEKDTLEERNKSAGRYGKRRYFKQKVGSTDAASETLLEEKDTDVKSNDVITAKMETKSESVNENKKVGRSKKQDPQEKAKGKSNDAVKSVATQPNDNLEVDMADPEKNEINVVNGKLRACSVKRTLEEDTLEEQKSEETKKSAGRYGKRRYPKQNVSSTDTTNEALIQEKNVDVKSNDVSTGKMETKSDSVKEDKKVGRSKKQNLKEKVESELNDAVKSTVDQVVDNIEVNVADPDTNELNSANSKRNARLARHTLKENTSKGQETQEPNESVGRYGKRKQAKQNMGGTDASNETIQENKKDMEGDDMKAMADVRSRKNQRVSKSTEKSEENSHQKKSTSASDSEVSPDHKITQNVKALSPIKEESENESPLNESKHTPTNEKVEDNAKSHRRGISSKKQAGTTGATTEKETINVKIEGSTRNRSQVIQENEPTDADTEDTSNIAKGQKSRKRKATDAAGSEDKKAKSDDAQEGTSVESDAAISDPDATDSNGSKWNLKIATWNVSGLRACIKKGFLDYLQKESPDIFVMQETKCAEKKLPDEVNVKDYHRYWCSSKLKEGHSGVALFSKVKPLAVTYGFGKSEDPEGRVITAEYDSYYVVNAYVPNSGRGLVNLSTRVKWDTEFREYLKSLDAKKPVIICGDMNVSHKEIDLANPKTNTKNAGFTIEERTEMDKHLTAGFFDSFRKLYPDKTGVYTFWTYMGRARDRNVGWRLDYFLLSNKLESSLCDVVTRSQVFGSDHCPIVLYMNI